MKKLLYILLGMGLAIGGTAMAAVFNSAQVGTNPVNNYYLQTNGSTSSWQPVSATGGSGTVSTSTVPTIGQIPYWTSNGYPSLLGSTATTSVTCTGTVSCTGFNVLGSSPITINGVAGTSASSTLLTDANTFTGVDKFTNTSSDFSGTWQTHAPAYFQTALGFTPYNATNPSNFIALTALSATYPIIDTSGVFSTALSSSTLTASSPLTGSFAQVGTGGTLGIQVANTSQGGYLTNTDWNTFNGKDSFAWPFTVNTGYNSTTTTLGFLNGFFSTASSTLSSSVYLPSLSLGCLYTTTNGLIASTGVACGSASGLSSYDAWTHPFSLSSATTSTMYFPGIVTTASSTIGSTLNMASLTASQILATDASKNVQALTTATYPSLTELSYVKGVTSAIQTQLNSKGTGNGTVTSVSSASGITGGAITTSGTLSLTNWLATSTNDTSSYIPYYTTTNGWPAKFGEIATSTLSASLPLTGSFTQLGSGGTLGCQTASGSQPGCLSSGDWTTFNNKGSGTVTAVSVASSNGFTGSSSGGATPTLTLTTSITGVLKGNGTAISAASNGTDFSLITALDCTGSGHLLKVTASGVFTCGADTGGLSSYDAFTHNTIGQSALASATTSPLVTTSIFAVGTSTPSQNLGQLQVSTTTANGGVKPQLILSDQAASSGYKHIYEASQGGHFYMGTSTDLYATSTNSALDMNMNAGTTASLGIATTSPFAIISAVGTGSTPLMAIASSTATGSGMPVYTIDQFGHQYVSGPKPTLSSCGTSPSVTGNDSAMIVTVGSVSATGCTITFANAYATAPVVNITNQSMSITNAMTFTVSTSAITITQTALTSAILDIQVKGIQ